MNCAATRHLHAGAFSKTLLALLSQCSATPPPLSLTHTPTHTHADRFLCKGKQMQMTELASTFAAT